MLNDIIFVRFILY